jgi:hypothetical protein
MPVTVDQQREVFILSVAFGLPQGLTSSTPMEPALVNCATAPYTRNWGAFQTKFRAGEMAGFMMDASL